MTLRRILRDSHPALRERAKPVPKVNHVILQLLDDMVETMREANGAGLAAPQIGIAKRIIVVDAGDDKLLQLINPVILMTEGSCVDVEGCLSVPGVYGEVSRAARITFAALDRAGQEVKLTLEGWPARILQHEIDHLDGILFIDKTIRLVDPSELKREEAK
ncbi:MAG: peptide deformylase [Bacillota bacterium]